MKNLYLLLLIAVFGALTTPAQACVDYWVDSLITVTAEYDQNFQEVLITVHNLDLFGGPNGAFCSCAVTSFMGDFYTNLLYIAFVDSGTYDPVPGFDVWGADMNAGNAWGSLAPGDWNGYIAEVIGPGITTGHNVELLIRAGVPPGYTFSLLDSALVASTVGTDEWDPIAGDLAMSHNDINLLGLYPITYTVQPLTHFANVDAIVTGIEDLSTPKENQLRVQNNGSDPIISLISQSSTSTLEVHDVMGAIHVVTPWNGRARLLNELRNGTYFIVIRSDDAIETKTIVVNR